MTGQPDPVVVDEVPSIGALSVIAIVGPERQPLIPLQDQSILDWQEEKQFPEQKLTLQSPKQGWRFWQRWQKKTHVSESQSLAQLYDCEHTGPRSFVIRIYGTVLKPSPKNHKKLCPDCCVAKLRAEAIRCCLCGFPILPGEPVAVYNAESVRSKDFDFTVVEGYALGCLRWDCCPSGGVFAGYWNGEGVDWYE